MFSEGGQLNVANTESQTNLALILFVEWESGADDSYPDRDYSRKEKDDTAKLGKHS